VQPDVKPDTIHGDTQGQSSAIFGLAYLFGIQLLPRIRDWKGKNFYRPAPETRFQHIDSLFTSQVDWSLIEAMLPELLRVAVSIKGGALLPSDILRRLGSYSRKNKLYFALRGTRLRRSYHVPIALRLRRSNCGKPFSRPRTRASGLTSSYNGSRLAATT
jgi:TnpA family transposase